MKVEIIKIGVTTNGKDIPVGEQRETDEASARSLIADGYAKEVVKTVAENALKSSESPSNPSGDKVPAGAGEEQTGGKQQSEGGTNDSTGNPNTEEERAKVTKALDKQYKRDELYEAAVKAGVEIAYDANKAAIVAAVIAQGKSKALLK